MKTLKDINTDRERENVLYDVEDKYRVEKLVYRPTYLKLWWYADNTDPDIEEYTSLEEAVMQIEVEGNNEPDYTFDPYNEIRVMFKIVWIDADEDVVEEGKLLMPSELYEAIEPVEISDDETSLHYHYFTSQYDKDYEMWNKLYAAVEDMVDTYSENGYVLRCNHISKYSNLDVYLNDEYVGYIKLRLANRSYNPRRNSQNDDEGKFISVVIADTDPTLYKYLGKYNIHFKPNEDVVVIVEAIKERITYIIENKI